MDFLVVCELDGRLDVLNMNGYFVYEYLKNVVDEIFISDRIQIYLTVEKNFKS